MSMDLWWQPVKPDHGEALSRELKYAISPTLWNHDGTLGGRAVLSADQLGFLKGMAAAGSAAIKKDVKVLIDAIDKYGAVEIWIE